MTHLLTSGVSTTQASREWIDLSEQDAGQISTLTQCFPLTADLAIDGNQNAIFSQVNINLDRESFSGLVFLLVKG